MIDGFLQNDPNGMFLDGDGVYHLYYQCENGNLVSETHANAKHSDNPTGNVAGNQH